MAADLRRWRTMLSLVSAVACAWRPGTEPRGSAGLPPSVAAPPAAQSPATGASSATAPVGPAGSTTVSAAPSPFTLVMEPGPGEVVELVRLGDATLLRHADDELALGVLRDGALVRDEQLAEGIASCSGYSSWRFTGTFPESAWLVADLNAFSACPDGPARVLRWSGREWRPVARRAAHQLLVAPWVGGAALVVEVPYRLGPPWGYELALFDAPPGAAAPRPRRVRHNGAMGDCYTELEHPLALLTSAAGAALVLGSDWCRPRTAGGELEAESAGAIVEHFAPGATRGELFPAPVALEVTRPVFAGKGPEDLWIAGPGSGATTTLAHFDGRGWSTLEVPYDPISHLAADVAGTLWMATTLDDRPALWRRRPGAADERIPLPNELGELLALELDAAGQAWIVGGSGVYRTVPAPLLRWRHRECDDADRAREERRARRWESFDRQRAATVHPCGREAGRPRPLEEPRGDGW
ncbi:MAG: hypothetical protein JW751_20190 [Polyangiaceae bacterium]|nr:hypothetical protein [Polyangiaceae bacterium]